MSVRTILKRYMLILEHIDDRFISDKKEIIAFVQKKGIKYSKRSFERDLESLRDEFGIEVVYNHQRKQYEIDYSKSLNYDSFQRLMQGFQVTEILQKAGKNNETEQYISYDMQRTITKGVDFMPLVLDAIVRHKIIRFTHHNFLNNEKKQIKIKPYHLKEYQYRWYVCGYGAENDKFWLYGLDRIENLEILDEQFETEEKKYDFLKHFDDVIGLAFNYSDLQEVKIWFDSEQCRYAKSQPWHHSQKVLEENKKGCLISMQIHPNEELKLLIMKHGFRVRVIEPQWLADEIIERHKKSLKIYK